MCSTDDFQPGPRVTEDDYEQFFTSDLAAEVRREYYQRAGHGIPDVDATRDVLHLFRDLLADPQEGPVIFLALAALQLQVGRLLPFVRDTALELIQTGEARRAYPTTDPVLNRKRKELLAMLEEELERADPPTGREQSEAGEE